MFAPVQHGIEKRVASPWFIPSPSPWNCAWRCSTGSAVGWSMLVYCLKFFRLFESTYGYNDGFAMAAPVPNFSLRPGMKFRRSACNELLSWWRPSDWPLGLGNLCHPNATWWDMWYQVATISNHFARTAWAWSMSVPFSWPAERHWQNWLPGIAAELQINVPQRLVFLTKTGFLLLWVLTKIKSDCKALDFPSFLRIGGR